MEYISLCKQSDLEDCNVILVANAIQIRDALTASTSLQQTRNFKQSSHIQTSQFFGFHPLIPEFSQFPILSGAAMTSLMVLYFVFVTRMTTHDNRHVRMVDDVIANSPCKCPPEFPQSTAAADDDVSVFFFGSGNHHLPRVTNARFHRSSQLS